MAEYKRNMENQNGTQIHSLPYEEDGRSFDVSRLLDTQEKPFKSPEKLSYHETLINGASVAESIELLRTGENPMCYDSYGNSENKNSMRYVHRDFVSPLGESMRINQVEGSEQYTEYNCSPYGDGKPAEHMKRMSFEDENGTGEIRLLQDAKFSFSGYRGIDDLDAEDQFLTSQTLKFGREARNKDAYKIKINPVWE